jgi:hypothetical protein
MAGFILAIHAVLGRAGRIGICRQPGGGGVQMRARSRTRDIALAGSPTQPARSALVEFGDRITLTLLL